MPKNDDLTAEERELLPLIEDLRKMYDTRIQDELDLGAIREQLSRSAGSQPPICHDNAIRSHQQGLSSSVDSP